LGGPIYQSEDGTVTVEVRDFGHADRTLVITTEVAGKLIPTMVSWSKFTDEFDAMRSRMMSGDWDEALSQLVGGSQ
jgi:hypothetical protein